MAVSDKAVNQVFDDCDADKDGKLDKMEAKEFYKQAFKFNDEEEEMTEEFEFLLFTMMDSDRNNKLERSNVESFCSQVEIGDSQLT